MGRPCNVACVPPPLTVRVPASRPVGRTPPALDGGMTQLPNEGVLPLLALAKNVLVGKLKNEAKAMFVVVVPVELLELD